MCELQERSSSMAARVARELDLGAEEPIQELSKKGLRELPPKFVQPIGYGPNDKRCNVPGLEIPVLDMAKDRSTVLNELSRACEEWGFFQVINHGIDTSVIRNLTAITKQFYSMPLEEKLKWGRKKEQTVGYSAFGKSSDGTSDWVDSLCMHLAPESFRNVDLVWPHKPESLRHYVDEYGKQVLKYIHSLAADISETLGLPRDYMEKMSGDYVATIRLNFYPCCPFPDKVLGVGSHSDNDTLTVLIEEHNEDGLEVFKDGCWVPVKPLKDALIINVGDVLQVMSNGKYKSKDHRALVYKNAERVSIVTNYSPALSPEVAISPATQLLSQSQPPLYKAVAYTDYIAYCNAERSLSKARVDSLLITDATAMPA